jgi:hypothetical protein
MCGHIPIRLRNFTQIAKNKNAQLDTTLWFLPGIDRPLHFEIPNQKDNLPARSIKTPGQFLRLLDEKL